MTTVFLIGNIASGKSTAARYLETLGARRIDLDALCKELYVPGSDLLRQLAEAFGADVLDAEGALRTRVLARRAFANASATKQLEAIVYPVLKTRVKVLLSAADERDASGLTIVEVSAPASFTDVFYLADEVLAIMAPYAVRRERAISRGMEPSDFEARAAVQPTDDDLRALATQVIVNDGDDRALYHALDAWLARRCPSFVSPGGAHA